MATETLEALASFGIVPDEEGRVRLYHATTESGATAILREKRLRPTAPDDPAQRMLARGMGHVFLASSPSIVHDLDGATTVLGVDVAVADLPAAPLRAGWGDPPRVELQAEIPTGEFLELAGAERVDSP